MKTYLINGLFEVKAKNEQSARNKAEKILRCALDTIVDITDDIKKNTSVPARLTGFLHPNKESKKMEPTSFPNHFVSSRCGLDQSVFDVLDELKASKRIPENAITGSRFYFGDEKTNPKIIGEITVRKNEMFSIVLP